MEFFPQRTVFLRIGTLSIRWYAVLIMTGAFLAYLFAKNNLKSRHNIDVYGFFDDLFVYMLWGGMIGARIWYCLFSQFSYYAANPIAIIRIWDGGVAIHGALLGGGLTAFWFCKRKNVNFLLLLDDVLPTVLLAQGIGRWGNFVNQECHGGEVAESYFRGLIAFLKPHMFINGKYYEPMFFYESCLCILGFILINFVLKKFQNKRGDRAWAYLMWYGVVRFFIESRRTDSLYTGTLKTAQLTSIVFFVVGVLGFVGLFEKLLKKKKPSIIFDLDGTITDSAQVIIDTYRELFIKYDREENFTRDKQVEVIGPALTSIFPKYFPDRNLDDLLNDYRVINDDLVRRNLKLMPYAKEVLEELKKEGYKLGVVTSRNRQSTTLCLQSTGIFDLFDDLMCFGDCDEDKPSMKPYYELINKNKWNSSDVVVIGDSTSDIRGGINYGAYTVGYIAMEEKADMVKDANVVISDLRDLLKIVNEDHYFTYNLR